ncbi:uncharacterized protein LOC130378386 [Gadus chalcogrammus]|uniref:uncharacterized protein LOC130378386 n=1 Tax=Gadus chalcogrammus TaxID=1042646 RepID=UPI0024C34D50|nr:uncharacterized protein LOC130378386 [Gadus chalcogrammus]
MEEIRKWEDEERAKQQEEEERSRREADQKQMEEIRKWEDEERAKQQEEEERARREADQKASTGSAAVMPGLDYISPRSPDSATSALCSQWPINLKLTHLELNKETPLIQFQGHYLNMSQLDYRILQAEIQNTPKTRLRWDLESFAWLKM